MGVSEIEEICCDDPILNVENLTVLRSGKLVLSDINLTVHKGEFIGIVGPNGSGKSTLLLSILGFLKAHQGNISIMVMPPIQSYSMVELVGYLRLHLIYLDKLG